jgi:methyl-accepting chemotaxis protein
MSLGGTVDLFAVKVIWKQKKEFNTMRLKDIPIAAKLWFAFGVVLFVLLIIAAFGWLCLGSVSNQIDQSKFAVQLNKEILAREIDHLKFMDQVGRFFSDPTRQTIDVQTDDHQCALGKWLYGPGRKEAELQIPALVSLLQKLEQPHLQLHASIVKINDLAAKQGKSATLSQAQALFEDSTRAAMTSVQTLLREVTSTIEASTAANREKIDSSVSFGRKLLLLLSVVSVGIGLSICFVITRSISGITRQLVTVTDSLAKGDMKTRSALDQKDEMGLLASSANNLAASLDSMCLRVNCSSSTINASALNLDKLSAALFSSAENMEGSCNTVAAAAEEMSANMSAIAAAAEETSTNVSMVAAATEEMTATISEIAASSENARVITTQAVQEAGKASASVQELGEAAQLINKVTETINEIADQTNLLALNATIEAARAGEAGKGFAVVANEIKDLAKQTTGATREIQDRIDGVQKSSEQTIAVINTIATIINNTNEIVSAMAAAVEEQAATSREIASNVSQASQGMQEVTENIAQASLANAEVSKDIALVKNEAQTVAAGSSDVKELAAEMKANAAALELLLNRFEFRSAKFDIGKIKDAHFNWKMRLTSVLYGYMSMESKSIPNHHQCDFGKWYDNAPQDIKSHPLFKEIGVHHEAVHRKVVEAVDLHNADKADAARAKVEEFEEVRTKLFTSLDELYIS